MKVNSKLISESRRRRAWSQDELATAAGLNLRTIQRIEAAGSASSQSLKSVASALEIRMEELKLTETFKMKFEYKTVVLPFKTGFIKQGLPDIQTALNTEGREGWQLKQIIMPSSQLGTSDSVVAVLERRSE